MVSRAIALLLLVLFALGLQAACDVERNLAADQFTCEAGGTCGATPDGGVRPDAGSRPDAGEEYDSGWPVDLDGLIPDFGACFPFC